MADRKPFTVEPFTVKVVDGAIVIYGTMPPDLSRKVRSVAERYGISDEEAIHLMLTEGAKLMVQQTPTDGQARKEGLR